MGCSPSAPRSPHYSIYVCVFFLPDHDQTFSKKSLNPPIFACNLWAIKGNTRGQGEYFLAQRHVVLARHRPPQTRWTYEPSVSKKLAMRPDLHRTKDLCARIRLGTLPREVTLQDIDKLCAQVPLPCGNEDWWDWAGRVVGEMQAREWLYSYPKWNKGKRSFVPKVQKRLWKWVKKRPPRGKGVLIWDFNKGDHNYVPYSLHPAWCNQSGVRVPK